LLLRKLRRLDSIADSAARLESGAWEGARENMNLAFSAAEIWALIGVGVEVGADVTDTLSRVVLVT
jgi:hypothetical protein